MVVAFICAGAILVLIVFMAEGGWEMVKLKGNRLRLKSGKVLKFVSKRKRATFERIAKAIDHGWRPAPK